MQKRFPQPVAAPQTERFRGVPYEGMIAQMLGGDLHQTAFFDQERKGKPHDVRFGTSAFIQRTIGVVGEPQDAGAFVFVREEHRAQRAVITPATHDQSLRCGFSSRVITELPLDPLAHHLDRRGKAVRMPDWRRCGVSRFHPPQENIRTGEQGLSVAAADERRLTNGG